MFRNVSKAAVAAIALATLASSASAATLTYDTSGTPSIMVGNHFELTFSGVSGQSPAFPALLPFGTPSLLGNFTLTRLSESVADEPVIYLPNAFTLQVQQTIPAGNGSSVTDVVGSVSVNGAGVALISFGNFTIGSYAYNPIEVELVVGGNVIGASDSEALNAIVRGPALAPVPIPAAAYGGLALISSLGVFRWMRKASV